MDRVGRDQALEGRLSSFELAYRMQATMPEVQDLSRESVETKKLYGLDDPVTENFGRQCLMARPLSGSWSALCPSHSQRQRSSMGSAW